MKHTKNIKYEYKSRLPYLQDDLSQICQQVGPSMEVGVVCPSMAQLGIRNETQSEWMRRFRLSDAERDEDVVTIHHVLFFLGCRTTEVLFDQSRVGI